MAAHRIVGPVGLSVGRHRTRCSETLCRHFDLAQPFFLREGLTWQLIASRINMRYLPPGYILDSGAPCAFLRPGVEQDELWFVLGWCLTETCTKILKQVINHTMNIQSKDIERLPYPYWVSVTKRDKIIAHVKKLVKQAQAGEEVAWDDKSCRELDSFFALSKSRVNPRARLSS